MKHLISAVLILLTAGVTLAADQAVTGEAQAQADRPIVARYLLMDTKGRTVTDKDFPGSYQLIAFGYTYCPDICPTTLAEMSLLMKRLGKLSDYIQPIFVTVDPERDTPAKLSQYTAFFHPRILGLTGSPAIIRRVADNFKVRYEKHYEPGGDPNNYSVDHSAGMYLLGPDGRFAAKFAYATPVSEIAERLRSMMQDTSSLVVVSPR